MNAGDVAYAGPGRPNCRARQAKGECRPGLTLRRLRNHSMYRGKSIVALVPAHNGGGEDRPRGRPGRTPPIIDTLLVIDDGSTDNTATVAPRTRG